MALVSFSNFRTSLRYAVTGLRYVYQQERNFRIHLALAGVAIALAIGLRISASHWLFVITSIVSVLALEIVNTVFEKLLDLFHPRVHHYAAIVKDLMAAAVLVASVSAVIVGVVIFIPRLINLIS